MRGARRAADVDATRGRRRRRRAQIVSSDAVQGEERERRGELVGKSHLWRSRLPVCYAHRFAPRLLVRGTMGWGCAVRDARSCSALLRAYLLASFESVLWGALPLREIHVVTLFFAGECSHAPRRRPGTLGERHDGYLGSLPKSSRPCLARSGPVRGATGTPCGCLARPPAGTHSFSLPLLCLPESCSR